MKLLFIIVGSLIILGSLVILRNGIRKDDMSVSFGAGFVGTVGLVIILSQVL